MDWNDFSYDEPPERRPDEYVISAHERLKAFFEKNNTRVFFGNQLAVQNEDSFFHWVTYRAIAELIGEGVVRTEARELNFGGEIKLLWHRSHRYYKRDAKKVIALVEEYGSPNIGGALGLHGEQMILAGLLDDSSFYANTTQSGIWIGSGRRPITIWISFLKGMRWFMGWKLRIRSLTWTNRSLQQRWTCVNTWESHRCSLPE
jgi:hypothetical protein